jgi:hypothetical protein
VRFGNPSDLSEALEKTRELVDTAENFAVEIQADLENLIDNMRRYDDGDGVDTLMDGINDFISEVEDILRKIK